VVLSRAGAGVFQLYDSFSGALTFSEKCISLIVFVHFDVPDILTEQRQYVKRMQAVHGSVP